MNRRSNEINENIKKIVELLMMHKPNAEKVSEEWLDAADVMNYLRIAPRTFYRWRSTLNWKRKKVGGKWYYAKDSIDGEIQG